MAGTVRVGTSGFSYDHWRGPLYPPELAKSRWLEYYGTQFDTLELNNPFYGLPKKDTFEGWAAETPPAFLFAVKASRYITHVKRLLHVEDSLSRMLANYHGLGDKLGPILFQFPPTWDRDLERLGRFLEDVPDNLACAFEFRHKSWFKAETYGLLRAHNAALCIADSPTYPKALELTAPFTFVRMHGGSMLCDSEYSEDELEVWAKRIRRIAEGDIDVFVYFNNDAHGHAVANARRIKLLLGLTAT